MLARQITLCFLLLVGASVCAQDEHRIQTKVDDVTVYQRGAQIRRSAAVRIDPGRQAIVFTGLPTSLVEQSIQVQAPNGNLIIVGVRYRLHYTEVGEENTTSQSFTADQEALARMERQLKTRLAIGQEEEAVLAANRNLGGSDSGLDADELERGVRYHRERITAIRMQRLELSDSLQLIEDQQRQLAATFSQASLDSTTVATGEVVVELESEMATSDSIYLTYLVAEAGWEPVYDLRLTDTDRPLGLSYGARVSQESGENWESVRLTLSTGDPGRSARLPELMPWRLAPYLKPPTYMSPDPGFAVTGVKAVSGQVTDESGLPLIGVMIVVSGTRVRTVTDIDGAYSIPLPPGEKFLQFSYTGYESLSVPVTGTRMDVKLSEGSVMLEEVVVVGYGRQSSLAGAVRGLATNREPASVPLPVTIDRRPTTLNFVVDLPYTIPSGESSRLVKIQDYTVPAEYRHTAVPKVDDRVFLSAVVHDWERLDLISGDMQLFVGGTFLGTTHLDVSQTADSLVFSLGPDPGVVVERSPSERYARTGGLLGGKRTVWRGWELTARNTKNTPVHLTVIDQVPLTADGSVDVESELPEDVDHEEATGQLVWEMKLDPSMVWQTEFSYRVRYSTSGPLYLE